MSKVNPVVQGQARLAIASVANVADVDFDYLLAQAKIESNLNPSAKAKTSSATGLFQFTKSTWLSMLDRHGYAYGAGWASDAIEQSGGQHRVRDPLLRQKILELRNDPTLSAAMAAEFSKENGAVLKPILGRDPDHAELYLAHFLGAGGAGKFLQALQSEPNLSGAALFPAAANANRGIFFSKDGSARSLSGVMDLIRNKVETAKLDSVDLGINTPPQLFDGLGLPSRQDGFESERISPPVGGPLAREYAQFSAALPKASGEYVPRKMSSILLDAFGQSNKTSPLAGAQVLKAYSKFQGFGM